MVGGYGRGGTKGLRWWTEIHSTKSGDNENFIKSFQCTSRVLTGKTRSGLDSFGTGGTPKSLDLGIGSHGVPRDDRELGERWDHLMSISSKIIKKGWLKKTTWVFLRTYNLNQLFSGLILSLVLTTVFFIH